jgi:hypothetical protein
MVHVVYPIPYVATTKVNGRRQSSDIAAEIEREIQDVDPVDAPVALSCKVAERCSGIHDPKIFRDAVFRVHNGQFYTPALVAVPGDDGMRTRPMLPGDLRRLGVPGVSFETPNGREFERVTNPKERDVFAADRLRRYQAGQIRRAHKLADLSGKNGPNGRDTIIAAAEADLAQFICINGQLWRQSLGEPIIRYHKWGRDKALIYLDENRDDLEQTEAKGSFRIDRMEDCLDHVKNLARALNGTDCSFTFWIKDIQIADESVLTFDDERDSLVRFGERIFPWLQYEAVTHEETLSQRAIQSITSLGHALEATTEEGLDQLATALRRVEAHWPLKNPVPADLNLVLERWELRPTAHSAIKI